MNNILDWFLINIILPLTPFGLRLYMVFIGGNKKLSFNSIAEIPDILFYSVFLCVIALNLNNNQSKRIFNKFVSITLYAILGLDLVTLSMIYNNNYGGYTSIISIAFAMIPASYAVVLKFMEEKEIGDHNG